MLEHHAGWVVHHDFPDHGGRHDHGQRQWIILQHPGNVGADRFHHLLEISGDLLVGAQMLRRRDHYSGGTRIHGGPRQRAHRGKSRRRDADDDLHVLRPLHKAFCHLFGLRTFKLRRLTQNAQHGHAVASDLAIKIRQPIDGFVIDAAVVVERRGRNGEGPCGPVGEFCHLCFYPLWSFRGAR